MPPALRALAEAETLQYLLQEHQGVIRPIITTAFWTEGDRLAANEPWDQVYEHGAALVRFPLMGQLPAVEALRGDYDLSQAQVELLQRLFRQKIDANGTSISLDWTDMQELLAEGSEGLQECRELLTSIGIEFPHTAD
jgi:hypothetical protein